MFSFTSRKQKKYWHLFSVFRFLTREAYPKKFLNFFRVLLPHKTHIATWMVTRRNLLDAGYTHCFGPRRLKSSESVDLSYRLILKGDHSNTVKFSPSRVFVSNSKINPPTRMFLSV